MLARPNPIAPFSTKIAAIGGLTWIPCSPNLELHPALRGLLPYNWAHLIHLIFVFGMFFSYVCIYSVVVDNDCTVLGDKRL